MRLTRLGLFSTVETFAGLDLSKLAYIRGIEPNEVAALPAEAFDVITDTDALFVLTNGEGQKLAIVEGRDAAVAAALSNNLQPVSVH